LGSAVAHAQEPTTSTTDRTPPHDELINTFEFEEVARRRLPAAVYAEITGSDRTAFDRMTFRPRVNVATMDMDLSVNVCGATHFTPIFVGPVAEQRRFHQEAELAMVRGAAAARASVIVSDRSSVPIEQVARTAMEGGTPIWYSAYADGGPRPRIDRAVAAGCTAVCITVGAAFKGSRVSAVSTIDWKSVERASARLAVPVLIKGIVTPADARTAKQLGAQGVIVSDHGGMAPARTAPVETVAAIVDAVGPGTAVLVDGGFRRGTDILKALILGAQGVLLARPVMWGLAAYGADGVQGLIEMLQNDLARNMAMIGASNPRSLNRRMLRIHGTRTTTST
jgi:4-hydroxymandelate oxidase